jgi:glycosyltransferase involved in cell wall biosynthesis
MKEYVLDGVNGFVVPTGSVDAIVDALRHLARQPFAQCSSLLSDSPHPALSA